MAATLAAAPQPHRPDLISEPSPSPPPTAAATAPSPEPAPAPVPAPAPEPAEESSLDEESAEEEPPDEPLPVRSEDSLLAERLLREEEEMAASYELAMRLQSEEYERHRLEGGMSEEDYEEQPDVDNMTYVRRSTRRVSLISCLDREYWHPLIQGNANLYKIHNSAHRHYIY